MISFKELTVEFNRITEYAIEKGMINASTQEFNKQHLFLESLRNDLFHFDEEKRARIIFNVTRHLQNSPKEDPVLISILNQVLQVVRTNK